MVERDSTLIARASQMEIWKYRTYLFDGIWRSAGVTIATAVARQGISRRVQDFIAHLDFGGKGVREFFDLSGIPGLEDTILMLFYTHTWGWTPKNRVAADGTMQVPLAEAANNIISVTTSGNGRFKYDATVGAGQATLTWAVANQPALQAAMRSINADSGASDMKLKSTDATADGLNSLNWNQTAGLGPPVVYDEVGPDGLPLPQPPHG